MSRRDRQALIKRDGAFCAICGMAGRHLPVGTVFHVDHVRPVARGGGESLTNKQLLCERCNLSKGASAPVTAGAVSESVEAESARMRANAEGMRREIQSILDETEYHRSETARLRAKGDAHRQEVAISKAVTEARLETIDMVGRAMDIIESERAQNPIRYVFGECQMRPVSGRLVLVVLGHHIVAKAPTITEAAVARQAAVSLRRARRLLGQAVREGELLAEPTPGGRRYWFANVQGHPSIEVLR